ncbi:MAG: DUF1015 domain-containing protein [Candidatus Hydrogenedentes bacterium]|nr:DUF1015 domain-containing protein [Candidatus Hydrogenedentota bacterium]
MLEVKGFHGLRYNPATIANMSDVITPPYDVITPEERTALMQRSPYNLVRLLLPEERDGMDKYEAAAADLNAWITEGGMVQDENPCIYLLKQQFTDLDGNAQTRRGFFGAIRLPEDNENYVLGHERTFAKPVEDRLKLTAATESNLGAVFGLYTDPDNTLGPLLAQMEKGSADIVADTIDGVKQELWVVEDDSAVRDFFKDQTIYIADGHHRFQTACTHRENLRAQGELADEHPANYALMGFVSFNDPGLKIYPPHRVVPRPDDFDADLFLSKLSKHFKITAVNGDLSERVKNTTGQGIMGVAIPNKGDYLLEFTGDRVAFLGDDRGPSWRDLDVALLHRGIIERTLGIAEGTTFTYEKSAAGAMKAAHEDGNLSFILQATLAEQICACADAKEPMPQKSTYFFPKLPSGGVIHRLK